MSIRFRQWGELSANERFVVLTRVFPERTSVSDHEARRYTYHIVDGNLRATNERHYYG